MMAVSVFDLDQFEQNIRDSFVDNSVGFAYSINQDGVTVRHDGWGDARTEEDGQVDFTEDTRMTIASVAKTITATSTLKILQDTPGVGVDSLISPYLPAAWIQGPNINTITFRELLTHQSGLRAQDWNGSANDDPNDNDTGPSLGEQTSYGGLQQLIALGIPNPNDPTVNLKDDFSYENANFALQRVMTAYLLGNGVNADSADDPAQFTADAYVEYVSTNVLSPMGIEGADTRRGDDDQILNYPFPNPSANGFPYDDRTLLAGGEGWWLSADELAQFLIGVRSNDNVLSPATRELMRDGFLGWEAPANYGFSSGMFGLEVPYYVHGGGLTNLESCIADYPNAVQVSLLVNSDVGPNVPHADAYDTSPTKHELLKRAYENAWPEFAVAGTANDDDFEVRLNPLDNDSVDIFLNGELVVTRWAETLNKLTLSGLGGDDTFFVDGLPHNIEVVLQGGTDNDLFTVVDTDIGMVQGDVTIDGGGGTDSLVFNEGWVFGAATYIITDGTTAKSSRVGQIHYEHMEELTVHGGNTDDTMYVYTTGSGVNVRVFGNAGDDTIVGGPAADLLDGGEGNDTIQGGSGNDAIYGQAGNDFIGGGQGIDLILCGLGNDIASGDQGNDTVVGDAGNDLVAGGEGNDTVTGGSGNDILVGGVFSAGAMLVAETGDDTLDGGDDADTLYGDSWALAAPLNFSFLGGADTIQGGSGNDTIYGQAGNDFIGGGLGNDLILCGLGNDIASGDQGNDVVHGESGNDLVAGGDGNDTVTGGSGNDILVGGLFSASASVVAETGDDSLDGGSDADTLFGDSWALGAPLNFGVQGGNDTLRGGSGNDLVVGQTGDDSLDGGEGSDTLLGAAGNDLLRGGGDNDQLGGGAGNDLLLGENGDDALTGGDGRDVLIGGLGADTLDGGADDDILIAGTTAHDANDVALKQIMNEWTSARNYQTRVKNIKGTGNGPNFDNRLNGTVFLIKNNRNGPAATVFDDDDNDTLTGSTGDDWFLSDNLDDLLDRAGGETKN